VCRRADDTVPVVCALVLEQHRDEVRVAACALASSCAAVCVTATQVWHVAFRRDGRRLASASKDGRVLVWEVSMQSVTAAAAAAAATARAPAATESSNNNNDDDDDDDERAEHAHDDMRLTFRLLTTLEHGAPVSDGITLACVITCNMHTGRIRRVVARQSASAHADGNRRRVCVGAR
jgi:hypothetical protein